MRARKRPPARSRVRVQPLATHGRQVDGRLPVPELAHVEVVLFTVEALAALPAQEDVARRVRDPLTAHDALAVVVVYLCAEVGLEDRGLCTLSLQHECVLPLAADEQEHPGTRADTPHAD